MLDQQYGQFERWSRIDPDQAAKLVDLMMI